MWEEHVHVAERFLHDGVGGRRVAEHGPIGARNIAALQRVFPELPQPVFVLRLRKLLDRSLMGPVERFLHELAAALRLARKRNALLVQIMLAGAFGAMHAKLD